MIKKGRFVQNDENMDEITTPCSVKVEKSLKRSKGNGERPFSCTSAYHILQMKLAN